ncbi:signal peptidase I [Archaeoglobus fulgidus]|uniref:Signal sequence peptidase, putative n=1 Tax=Archaeoglobus fulgidus (strain ATCC 49558 / DSM 4304 / JCM 9628 / NBRC 100126 / VC-16) TaxID=224325 RepID=O28618_ARCFU|nr:signal peptidase I [Archaeoglobus fulgidus]AAB89589.1 signal sequence peptidase, putative [Archaeoglobus fulgidus DSM 4304]
MNISGLITALFVVFILFSAYEVYSDDVRILVVLSSSMEPLMHPGDLIVVKRSSDVSLGDVVAFKDPSGKKSVLITHRVVEIGDGYFKTKGDAVEDVDPFDVHEKDVYGKFLFGIPYIGYLFHEFKNRNIMMYLLFILIPASVLMASEFRNLTMEEKILKRRERIKLMHERRNKKALKTHYLVVTFAAALIISFAAFNPTLEVVDGGVINKGFLTVYLFHSEPPYYSVLNPGESASYSFNTAINGAMPLILLYPLYRLGILWLTPLVTSAIATLLLKPVYYKPRKKHIGGG